MVDKLLMLSPAGQFGSPGSNLVNLGVISSQGTFSFIRGVLTCQHGVQLDRAMIGLLSCVISGMFSISNNSRAYLNPG